ncbi:hypothetical protein AAJ76_2890001953 [Vairimorpha ceranae]|uniref:Uncharacterized protein n=1 Tax=Vairimorpha ceranae TaxID=40302 RepID=A0A0F9Z706_9MICR|nr:hypothetical protein AAJ76_2890001953 [Vairimorpha ceranae]KKO73704.1 hypothetical protein AAJ76_2890001953 [Vairimorpha ceranae]
MQEIEGHMFEVVCTGDMLATEIGALMLATKIRTFCMVFLNLLMLIMFLFMQQGMVLIIYARRVCRRN